MTPTPAGTTHRRTLRWQSARVLAVRAETPRARTLRLALPEPRGHLAGQHYVLRLTAPDGYTAARSYSVASAPDDTGEIELTVERLPGGEVSEFVHDVVVPGDELEVRGPIGGFFVWSGDTPAMLVGGGSGVVPLMSMLRLARRSGRSDLVRLVVSARSPEDLYYADELPGPETTVVYTRQAPPGAGRAAGRLAVADVAPLVRGDEDAFVCGSAGFAEAATTVLLAAGVSVGRVKVERFGPSG
jgi:ferredoxin-NADP reductase